MWMKTQQFSSVVLVTVLVVSLLACSNPVVGTYVNVKHNKNYMELRSDGTFYVRENGVANSGKYRVDGNVLTLTIGDGLSAQGKIAGNTITDDEGQNWVKK